MLDHDRVSCLNAMNTKLTLNAMNANLTLNASANEHRSVNPKVISIDNKITSINAKIVTVKSTASNCMNSKSMYDTCANNVITVRSRYAKFICEKNHQSQSPFIRNYRHRNCLYQQH